MTYPTATTETTGAREALAFPVPDIDDDVEIKDFTLKQKVHKFRIDDDVFVAHAALGLPAMQDLVKLSRGMSDAMQSGNYDGISAVFAELLAPNSAARFTQRVQARGADAIDVKNQLIPILYWLLEKYGLRPTQPSSSSSGGSSSETSGTTSTGGSSTAATS